MDEYLTEELLAKAREQMDAVEKTVYGVPGIKGYKEKELRREVDKTVRDMLARQLADQRARLTNLQVDLVVGGQLSLVDDLERSGIKLQTLTDRIRTASYGYAPLFDDVRVKEAELDALAKFDLDMFAGVERIKTMLDNMSTLAGRPEAEWMESIRALNATLDDLNTEFGHRNEVILNVTPTGGTDLAESPAA